MARMPLSPSTRIMNTDSPVWSDIDRCCVIKASPRFAPPLRRLVSGRPRGSGTQVQAGRSADYGLGGLGGPSPSPLLEISQFEFVFTKRVHTRCYNKTIRYGLYNPKCLQRQGKYWTDAQRYQDAVQLLAWLASIITLRCSPASAVIGQWSLTPWRTPLSTAA